MNQVYISKFIATLMSVSLMLSCEAQKQNPIKYPETKKVEQVSSFHGTKIVDQFAWLDEVESEQVKKWVKQQDSTTRTYVRSYPQYEKLKSRIENLSKVSGSTELPTKAGDQSFYLKEKDGAWTLKKKQSGNISDIGLPFNPRAAYFYIPSVNGKNLALGIARPGGYFDWKVVDVTSDKVYPETMIGADMGNSRLSWDISSQGFYYISHNKAEDGKPRSELRIKYHKIGTENSSDKVIYKPTSDGSKLQLNLSDDGKYLIIAERIGASTAANLLIYNIQKAETLMITEKPEASYIFLGNDGPLFYFETDLASSNGKIVSVNIEQPTKIWKDVIAEGESIMGFQSAGGTLLPIIAGNKFVIPVQKDLKISLKIHDLTGKFEKRVELPAGGLYFNTNGYNALSGIRSSNEVLLRFIGITEPNTIFSVNVIDGKLGVFERASVNFDAGQYTSEIIFAQSKDGTKVPISLTYKKGTKLDGSNFLMLQVYGAIAFTNYPYFQGDYIAWLEMGGIHAVAHIRGGGAYGSKWHQDGIARKKQNGIDDYIAAIETVMKHNYTGIGKVVVNGTSAGTIPIAAALTQRPDLIGAVVSHYGMIDMIGYADKFGSDANHGYMIPDLGKASDLEDFKALNAYSPYQKLDNKKCYPPVLGLTSDADSPLNADTYKFIAALQQNNKCKNPMLLQMAWGSGHSGFGSQEQPSAVTFTDELAFLIKALNIDASGLVK